MKLLRVEYNHKGDIVSNEVFAVAEEATIGKFFAHCPDLEDVLFTKANGEEILWSRWPTE